MRSQLFTFIAYMAEADHEPAGLGFRTCAV
jgi:hypothetical protein